MQGQKLVIDKARNGEGIESFHEELVGLLIVLVDTLRSEVEELGHLAALVVPSQHVNGGRVVQLQGIQKKHHLTRERASVYVVS